MILLPAIRCGWFWQHSVAPRWRFEVYLAAIWLWSFYGFRPVIYCICPLMYSSAWSLPAPASTSRMRPNVKISTILQWFSNWLRIGIRQLIWNVPLNEPVGRQHCRPAGDLPFRSTLEKNSLETLNAARFFNWNCHHPFAVPSLDNLWCFAYTTFRFVDGVCLSVFTQQALIISDWNYH